MRKTMTVTVVLLSLAVSAGHGQTPTAPKTKVQLYKTPTCGCCAKWGQHLERAGFEVTTTDMPQAELGAFKTSKGIPEPVRSCHTALIGNYVVEGHVPVDVVQKLLKEKPKTVGIAVPGMPAGSPGMESPNPVPYDVLTFDSAGTTAVFAKK
jgi:hypothetical protein